VGNLGKKAHNMAATASGFVLRVYLEYKERRWKKERRWRHDNKLNFHGFAGASHIYHTIRPLLARRRISV
jgi:hypothetical protein